MAHLLFLYTESALHAGTGSTVSVVDLPIQRERTTQYPMMAGSGLKGALRSQYTGSNVTTLFGPDTKDADKHAGAIAIGDARILLFPVQSLIGVFAFTTSHHVLARLLRDSGADFKLPAAPPANHALVTSQSDLIAGAKVVLEEFSFTAQKTPALDQIAEWLVNNALPTGEEYAFWREKLARSLIVLPDADFRDFCQTSTEVHTRVRLERGTKTVAKGALWTEERLPSDSLLYAPLMINAARDNSGADAGQINADLQAAIPARIQLGGDETTGSGIVAVRWL